LLVSPLRPAACLAALVLAIGLAAPTVAAGARPAPGGCVASGANHPGSGAAAVRALGPDLTAAAALNRTTASGLASLLTSDPTTRIDACGRVFYVDPVQGASDSTSGSVASLRPAATVAGGLDPSGDVLSLQSRPGSKHTIYLDVHGRTLTGTAWNSYLKISDGYVLAPFSLDADTAHLSATEESELRAVWLAVAEDYAPFDVNVTTKDPGDAAIDRTGTNDDTYGTRALITSNRSLIGPCGCSGIAYLGVFANWYNHAYYQPALVFPAATDGSAHSIAEVVSHEVGHNFGLHHDGIAGGDEYYVGQGVWGPIMGVGFRRPLTQWSIGDYAKPSNTEDDTAIIAQSAPYVADERGTDAASAPWLRTGRGASGVVAGPADSDWYAISSTGGRLSVTVATQAIGSDLDARLDLYRADGSHVVTADPPTPLVMTYGDTIAGLSASWSGSVAAGSYLMRVSGTGHGNPLTTGYSSYGSVGRYTITAVTPQAATLAVFSSSAGEAVQSLAYRAPLVAVGVGGPTTWALASGSLPTGVTLDPATGVLSGTATVLGRSSFTVQVSDGTGRTASRAFVLAVVDPVAMVTTTWPGGTAGRSYTSRGRASGGSGSYTWTRVAGSLPPGMALSSAGVLTGRPTVSGRFTFSVRVADYRGSTSIAGRSVRRAFTVRIVRPLAITSARLAAAKRGRAYLARLSAVGGNGSYSWARSGGSLPRGLTLSSTGRITGRAARAGTYRITLLVRDAAGHRAGRTFTLVVR
jgi:hypothetical protein